MNKMNNILGFENWISMNESGTPIPSNWKDVANSLNSTAPKVINFNYDGEANQSLNWGTHNEKQKNWNFGFSISAPDMEYTFQTKDQNLAKKFDAVAVKFGVEKTELNDLSRTWGSDSKLPKDITEFSKAVIALKV